MSKLHRDNAGYVGVSYEETQDPFYTHNKLALPLGETKRTAVRDQETITVTQANSKYILDGTVQKALTLEEGSVYIFDQSSSSNTGHPLRFSEYPDGTHGNKFGIFNGTDSRYLRESSGNVLAQDTSVTIEGHIKPNTNIIRGFFDGGSGQGNIIRNYGGNTFAKQAQESNGATIPTSEVKVGEWQHLAVTFRAGANNALQIWVFIDGVRVATGGLTGGYVAGSTFDIGTINGGGDGKFDGLIRNFRVTFGTVYPYNFTAPAYTSNLTSSANTFEIPRVWGQLNTNSYADSLAQVNPRQMPFTLPVNYDCLDFECVPNGSNTADFTVEFGSAGASYDAYYYDTSNNWQSLGSFTNAANTSRTFTPGATFKGIRLYSTTGNLGAVVIENAYYETGSTSARLMTMVTSLGDTSGSGRGLTNNDVVLGPTEYTTGVTPTGTPGQVGAQTKIVVPFGAPDLYYYCSQHPNMGSSAETPVNDFMFTGALPILKTDRFGKNYAVTASTSNIEFGYDNSDNAFDTSTTSLTKDVTGYTFNTWSGSQLASGLGGVGANSAQVWKHTDGNVKYWHVSTDTSHRYLWVSDNGTNWSHKGTNYDTDGSTQIVEGRWLAVAGGSNSSTITVSASDTPDAVEDSYAANLVLAIPMNVLGVGGTFRDVSPDIRGSGTAKTITRNNTQPSTAQGIFYGSSADFDGTNDNLKLPANDSDFQFGSGDFTIETWFNPDSTARMAIYHGSDGDDHSIGIDYSYITQTIAIWASSNGTSWNIADGDSAGNRGSIVVPVGVWTHIAYVRYGSKFRLYINGVLDKEFTNTNSIVTETESPVIGEWYNAGYDLNGYLADFRIYKGVAKYTSNFFIPEQIDTVDRSGSSNNAMNLGTSWQTGVKKFYDGALATNTKRRGMRIDSNDFNVGTGNFTLEFWVYSTSSAQEGGVWPRFISTGTNATTAIQVGHIGSATGRIRYTHSDNSQYAHGPDTDFLDQWVHVAVVRESGEVSVYCNGISGSKFTDTNAKTNTTMYISGYDYNSGAMTGYIQDVRWYANIAKYTSSFTPPERSVEGTARRYPSGVYLVS